MTLISLNFIQFYQFSVKTGLTDKRSSMASINDVSVVCEKRYALTISEFNNEWNQQIDNNDLIEVLDLTGPSSENLFDLFYKQTPNLKGTELCAESNIHRFWLWWTFNNSVKYLEQTRSQWMRWRERRKPFIRQGTAARCWRNTRIATNGLEFRWSQECEHWEQQQQRPL